MLELQVPFCSKLEFLKMTTVNPRDKSMEEHHDNIGDPFCTVISSNKSFKFQDNQNSYAELDHLPQVKIEKCWIC